MTDSKNVGEPSCSTTNRTTAKTMGTHSQSSFILGLSRVSDFRLVTASDLFSLDQTPSLGSIEDQDTLLDDVNDAGSFYTQIHRTQLPQLLDYFEFQDKIGFGGFGDIYRAFDLTLHRTVAIKTLREEGSNKHSSRCSFITEAKVTALLDHPNIIPIHGMFTDPKRRLHLVMKLIEGQSLKKSLRQTINDYKRLPSKEIQLREKQALLPKLEIFLKICDAVSYAHEKRILHRDLKPGNVMLGNYNEVYVMDWGLSESRDIPSPLKKTNFYGTPQYIAPEIILDRSYDSRSDIYSLGTMLFELVYMKKPFPSSVDLHEIRRLKAIGKVAPPKHQYNLRIHHDLRDIIKKAMSPSPAERYQTVQCLSADIRRFMRGERISDPFYSRLLRRFTL